MRAVLNISLPKETVLAVKKEAKLGGFATTSEYIRYLIRTENTRKLAEEIEISKKEFKEGKGKVLNSLKDLL